MSPAGVTSPGLLAVVFGVAGVEVDTSVGIGHGCELGMIAGFNRLGGEARCTAVSERDGDPISVAPFVRGGYQPGPAWLPRGPWFAAGIDASRGRLAALAVSPTISYGVEPYSVDEPSPGIDEESFVAIGRREWRVSLPVGFVGSAPTSSSRGGRFVFGIVPYWTFAHGAATCGNCKTTAEMATASSFSGDWGILFAIGGGWVPLRPAP